MNAVEFNQAQPYDRATWKRIQVVVGAKADGKPGTLTTEKIRAWQAATGLCVDGKAGKNTLHAMRLVPHASSLPLVLHPVPVMVRRWGFDHAQSYPEPSPQWAHEIGGASWLAAMMRLLTTPHRNESFSRTPESYTSLDTFSVGLAHWHAGTAGRLFLRMAEQAPCLVRQAWGGSVQESMLDPEWIARAAKARRGHTPHARRLDGLAAGWKWLASHTEIRALQVAEWLAVYVPKARNACRDLDWSLDGENGGLILAAVARLYNSGGAMRRIRGGISRTHSRNAMRVLENVYTTDRKQGGYNHPKRWARLGNDAGFDGPAPTAPSPKDLDWS